MTERGVVAAGDRQTAAAGAELLSDGGNAVDAAVGAAFASFVCEMPLASPLGGGVLVTRDSSGSARALEFFARVPGLGAPPGSERDFHDVEVDFGATTQVFHIGKGSAAVPLALPGLLEAHDAFGALPFARVLEPAIRLGSRGYELGDRVAFVFHLLAPIAGWSDGSRSLYYDGGELARAGARLHNRALAAVLEELARDRGVTRALGEQLVREHGPGAGGTITAEDLARAEPVHGSPLSVRLGARRVSTAPAPSTGGALVALGARLLSGVGERASFLSAEHVAEVALAQEVLLDVRTVDFAERLRDPKFVAALLSDDGVQRLRNRAAVADNPLGSTTHISALDARGGAASLTLTNGEGSGWVLADTGMHVNNLLGEEDINPRGFHAEPPGTVLTTMMAPTVVDAADGDCIALGSGGSNRLRNAILMTLTHLLEFGVSPERAVLAPRLHLENAGGRRRLAVEAAGQSAAALDWLLARYGQDSAVFEAQNMYFGGVHVASSAGPAYFGHGDPRRGGAVAFAR